MTRRIRFFFFFWLFFLIFPGWKKGTLYPKIKVRCKRKCESWYCDFSLYLCLFSKSVKLLVFCRFKGDMEGKILALLVPFALTKFYKNVMTIYVSQISKLNNNLGEQKRINKSLFQTIKLSQRKYFSAYFYIYYLWIWSKFIFIKILP